MDSLTSHFQSTSRAQRVRYDKAERGRLTQADGRHTQQTLQCCDGGGMGMEEGKSREEGKSAKRKKKKRTGGFRSRAVILRNKSSESRGVIQYGPVQVSDVYIPIFIPSDIRRSYPTRRCDPGSFNSSVLAARKPATAAAAGSANSITRLHFRYPRPEINFVLRSSRNSYFTRSGVDESRYCHETR